MKEKVVKDLIIARNIIRKKYKTLKSGRLESTSRWEEILQPITSPLKQLTTKSSSKSDATTFKDEPELPLTSKIKRKKTSLPLSSSSSSSTSISAESIDSYPEESLKDSLVGGESSTDRSIRLLDISDADFDNKYGPYFSADDKVWKIGSSPFTMNNQNIFINDKVYKLTDGLKLLIFLKEPNLQLCNNSDISDYLEIVRGSNVMHRNYDETQQIAGNKSFKYKLIKNISKSIHTGSGLMEFSTNKTDYVYWDDPNELVDRLKLLFASQQAGHNNHNNEIISIIEELREAKIIV